MQLRYCKLTIRYSLHVCIVQKTTLNNVPYSKKYMYVSRHIQNISKVYGMPYKEKFLLRVQYILRQHSKSKSINMRVSIRLIQYS
jgi:Holliday junction resolvase RusA-like endonuclease